MKEKQALLVKDMPDAEKPRERLLGQGAQVLSNTELLAILIQTGAGRLSSLDLAAQVLAVDRAQGVKHLASCSQEQLMAIHGIGPSKACQILAAIELGKRVYSGDFSKKPRNKISR